MVCQEGLKFLAQNRQVAFTINNWPAHPHVPGLTAINLTFLLPNTTSIAAYGSSNYTIVKSQKPCQINP